MSRALLVPGTLLVLFIGNAARAQVAGARPVIDFDRQIRPILAENCFACHGPDEQQRKAKLRLDHRDDAVKAGAIVPGQSDESLLLERVASADPRFRMPPPKTGKQLGKTQIELLKAWIDQGATWPPHWSFVPPRRPDLPTVSDRAWPRNEVDYFILARLDRESLHPSREADWATLVRRLSLDLTGLPPTIGEIDAFLADSRHDAYERLVDRLLGSPHYGERMALDWLDAARFADTHGYHRDAGRDMTHWRDWVINAFNRNMPFDQFTVEQIAGDLLPDASVEQQVASGFHRNHMIMIETGAVPEEYQTAYVVDRVNTTGTVWLGLTLACAQCHDHKFDPISQRDYYRLFALFNTVPENGIDGGSGNAEPLLRLASASQQQSLDRLSAEMHALQTQKSADASDQLKKLRQSLEALEKQMPTTMVMREMEHPRETMVLVRGQYDRKGERVQPGVPASLPPLPNGAPANRLGLARWLTSPENPLTARVIVNRLWQATFGAGIVKTSDDFGTQGDPPSHPELLDWLATEFVRSGWDVKHIQRLIVTSATYRQASAASPELVARDPENRLLARGPRFRLQAETLRDQALAVSGLLDRTIGGASVFPPQPPGLWEELCSRTDSANLSAQSYTPSQGRALYRRSLYIFWKRTVPPPNLAAFDAPDRETCTVRRPRTNTPLQALVLLNDPVFVEAARKLAERVMSQASGTEDRIALAFRLGTGRRPSVRESAVLHALYDAELEGFRARKGRAASLLKVGSAPCATDLDPKQLATWTVVASAVLNLDEVVSKN